MMKPLVVPSPAKLNLFLHITGQREDGYHNLQTVFQIIDLHDTLTFTLNEGLDCQISANIPEIPLKENLIYRAWDLLRSHYKGKPGVQVQLEKRIPMGGGLGGGSSNAATTLLALNQLWNLQLPHALLMDYGKRLGADVPIFIYGHNAFAEGIGELLTPIELPHCWYVLVFPQVHVNTRELFSHPHLTKNSKPITIRNYQAGVNTTNVFTPLVCQLYPEVAHAIECLNAYGQAKMSGSGSTVFLPVESEEIAHNIVGHIDSQLITCVAQSLRESSLISSLQTSPI